MSTNEGEKVPPDHPTWHERIETKIDILVARIDKVEARASFWGAVGGAMALMAMRLLGGCG